jgi:hypothetical protein
VAVGIYRGCTGPACNDILLAALDGKIDEMLPATDKWIVTVKTWLRDPCSIPKMANFHGTDCLLGSQWLPSLMRKSRHCRLQCLQEISARWNTMSLCMWNKWSTTVRWCWKANLSRLMMMKTWAVDTSLRPDAARSMAQVQVLMARPNSMLSFIVVVYLVCWTFYDCNTVLQLCECVMNWHVTFVCVVNAQNS